jgi:hypothetical protein
MSQVIWPLLYVLFMAVPIVTIIYLALRHQAARKSTFIVYNHAEDTHNARNGEGRTQKLWSRLRLKPSWQGPRPERRPQKSGAPHGE